MDYVHSRVGLVYNMYPEKWAGCDYSGALSSEDVNDENEKSIRSSLNEIAESLIKLRG